MRCRPEQRLAAKAPSASLFGTATIVTISSVAGADVFFFYFYFFFYKHFFVFFSFFLKHVFFICFKRCFFLILLLVWCFLDVFSNVFYFSFLVVFDVFFFQS